MPQVTFTYSAGAGTRIVAWALDREEKPDGVSDADHAKEVIRKMVIEDVRRYETREAAKAVAVASDDGLLS